MLSNRKVAYLIFKIFIKSERIYEMRNLLITSALVTGFAGAAFAETTVLPYGPTLSGKAVLTFAETAADKWAATPTFDLGIDVTGISTVNLDFSATDGNSVTLDNWTIGTQVAGIDIAIGDDNGVMPGAEGEQTLTAPAMAESVQVNMGAISAAIGFTDIAADITDISNVQGAIVLPSVAGIEITAAADYNLNTENTVFGAGVTGVDLGVAAVGGAVSYDVDTTAIGYELVAKQSVITTYINGDDTDMLQNIGGEFVYGIAGAELTTGANYNLNSEDFSPSIELSFAF